MTLKDQVVLVTGGTGSFGNFIVARLLNGGVGEIRIFSRDEKKQYDMRNHYSDENRLNFYVGDIRDRKRLDDVMDGVDIVFQAAALKQVPSCETHPWEAIKTNVLGVENVIDSAMAYKVPKLVCLSTDKAIKPVNVMGMTKALQERLVIAANRRPGNNHTLLSCVRYGNVMNSRGSAIPFFRKLASEDKMLTITDVEMTRFLLTLGDAMELVFFAAETMNGGEVFVKKSPSVKIIDLAKAISNEIDKEFKYKEIGIFPGEKIHEILISEEELNRTEDDGDFFRIHPNWVEKRFDQVEHEYCSKDCLVDTDKIKELLHKSDTEFRELRFSESVFTKL